MRRERHVLSPAAKAAPARREGDGFFLLSGWVTVHTPETLGFGGRNRRGTRQNPRLEETSQHQGPSPGSSYQPRFRQSKVMTPFSSGVHLMPGGNKGGFFHRLRRLLQGPRLDAAIRECHTPGQGPRGPGQQGVGPRERPEATGEEGGQPSAGTLSTHTAQTQRWGLFPTGSLGVVPGTHL